jgi:hypothetical protein
MDLSKETTKFASLLSATLAEMAEPKLVWHQSLALPWNTPNVETRILDGYVDVEGAAHIPGAIDIKSRLASSFYATVAIPEQARDLINPSKYLLKAEIGPLLIFARTKH